NSNVTIPPGNLNYDATVGIYDSLEYVPGYGTYVLNPGHSLDYYSCDLGPLIPETVDQIETYPVPRFQYNHTLNENINWTDTKYLGGKYSGSCGSLVWSPNPTNDARIQTELCKHWNYMYSLSKYDLDTQTSILTSEINSNPNYKVALITNMHEEQYLYQSTPSVADSIRKNDLITAPQYTVPSGCAFTQLTFDDPRHNDYYKLLARLTFKNAIDRYIIGQQMPSLLVPLARKIDFVSENSMEKPFYVTNRTLYSCLFSGTPVLDSNRLSIASLVPTNTVVADSTAPNWDDYFGYLVGNSYKTYADALINDNTAGIYKSKVSSDLFNANTKCLFYLISSIYGMNSSYFENYNTKRFCNSPYILSNSAGTFTNYYSTPNFYPWTGPLGWYQSSGPRWGLDQAGVRLLYEVPIGDRMYAPYVSARWGRDVLCLRPGQYLGFLKALGMYGVDFFHVGYFNVTEEGDLWPVKKQAGDNVGFANDSRTWVWQLATASYAQAISSRYEAFIKNSEHYASGKLGNDYYVINKLTGSQKYLIYGTEQTMSNFVGTSPISKNINLAAFNPVINNFKINVRRQGSTYMLDMTVSPPVFYQLDKWHQYEHPCYWIKDFNFEAEVDDSGNTLELATERPSNAAPGDYTDFTTGVKLNSTNNNVKYIFTPRDVTTSNNKYQLWVRMKLLSGTKGRVEVKLDGTNTFVIDSVKSSTWQWYGFESCGATRMILRNQSANNHTITLTSGSNNLIIDQVCLKMDTTLTLQSQPAVCSTCCGYSYRQINNQQDTTATGVAKPKESISNDLNVFPNPASNSLYIVSKNLDSNKKYRISFFDMLGIEVKRDVKSKVSEGFEINVSELANGMYTLILKEESINTKTSAKRVVIQH
ncbi:MAG: T9SS type A sorting domain-containing protein, partial [Bacteroidia bacterium]|nr:T9SS type A sorting domain-containing protein [Bacteroidia bacterium]